MIVSKKESLTPSGSFFHMLYELDMKEGGDRNGE